MMMTTEEKAKAYDKAIEELRGLLEGVHEEKCEIMEEDITDIFPELKEPEDEKIRKALIDGFTVMKESKNCGKTFSNHNIPVADILAWLEKQGKRDARYKYLEELLEADTIYQMAVNNAMVEEAKTKAIEAISNMNIWDLLEPKKQGEQKPYGQREECFDCQMNYAGECKGSCTMKRGEQKLVDKSKPFDKYEGLSDFERTLADICIGWIGEEPGWKQYIKDNSDVLLRVAIEKFNSVQDAPSEEQKPTWSKEDETYLDYIITTVKLCYPDDKGKENQIWRNELLRWLKSLGTRVGYVDKWEPSEEQMKVLSFYADQNNSRGSVLTSLLDDLKKFKNK